MMRAIDKDRSKTQPGIMDIEKYASKIDARECILMQKRINDRRYRILKTCWNGYSKQ